MNDDFLRTANWYFIQTIAMLQAATQDALRAAQNRMLEESLDRVDKMLQNEDCARAVGNAETALDVFRSTRRAGDIQIKDLGPIGFRTLADGTVEGFGRIGYYNPILTVRNIGLNSRVNWFSPNDTQATWNGNPFTYRLLDAQSEIVNSAGYKAGTFLMKREDLMDLVVLHELGHRLGVNHRDSASRTSSGTEYLGELLLM